MSSVVIPLVLIIIISRGDFSGFQASMRGIEGVGENASILGKMLPITPFVFVLTVIGFGMLIHFLRQSGDIGIAALAFILILISQVFILIQGTFHGSVTVWAAKELADTGSVPELFKPHWRWIYSPVQQTYTYLGLLALVAYEAAILHTGLLVPWLGWGLIGWGGIWFILFLIVGDNLPLVLFVPPIVVGIVAILDSG